MGRRLSVTRVARAVALVCALAALLVPGVAMAAGGASFSSATPRSGSYFMGQTPKVSVTVYDKDGVRGSANYALYVDGAKVRPSISYVAGYGYRKFKLTYQVTRPLSVGASHKIKATVKDRTGHSSSYSWSFYADSSAPAAVFGSPSPQDGSRILDVRPTISISVLDRWNVAASGVRLTMDGASVAPQVTFANPHALSVSFRPASALSAGTHTVALSVRDAGGRTTSTSWSFAVYPDMPASGSACVDCHAGFPAAHPMTACASCHGPGAPPRPAGGVMAPYTASDTSAHTLACSLESPCHGGGGDFPHALDSDCMRCHTGTYSGIPAWHGPLSAVPHTSTSAFCTSEGCHFSSLTVEHFRYTSGGAPISCATCHASTDASVAAAIAAGDTACTSCHSFATSTHPGTGSVHAAASAPSCTVAGCHSGGSDVARIHAPKLGCATCHGAGKTPTLDCSASGCHPDEAPATHDAHPATISTGTVTILGTDYAGVVCSSCHGVLELQRLHGGKTSCVVCHPAPRDTLQSWSGGCVQGGCHSPASTRPIHAAIDGDHTPSTNLCGGSDCHGTITSIVALHAAGPGCAACHGAGKTPSKDCSSCHAPHDLPGAHLASPAAESISIGGTSYGPLACSTCHDSADVRTLHTVVADPACGTCHPGVRSKLGSAWEKGCVQGSCHSATSSAPKHANLTAAHSYTLPAGWTCIASGCHGGADLASLHAQKLSCATCHGEGKTPTSDCKASGCHASGAPAVHASHPSTVTAGIMVINGADYDSHNCTECHTSMELQALHGGAASCSKCHPNPAGTAARGSFACAQGGCHTANIGKMEVFHGTIDAAHRSAAAPSCTAAGCHAGGNDVAAIHASAFGCATCHGSGKTPTLLCSTVGCHDVDPTSAHGSHPATVTAGPISINGTSYGTHNCSECHASMELQGIHGGATSCVKCHPTPARTATDKTYACAQGGCHTSNTGSMETQHGELDAGHTATNADCSIGSGCHNGGSDVAKLHAPAQGCSTCHSQTKKGSLNCGGCHAATRYAAHPTVHAVCDNCHFNGTNYGTCWTGGDCHGGHFYGPDVDAVGTDCSVCHDGRTTWTHPVVATDCTYGCHDPKYEGSWTISQPRR